MRGRRKKRKSTELKTNLAKEDSGFEHIKLLLLVLEQFNIFLDFLNSLHDVSI